jgi:hypothetical protein
MGLITGIRFVQLIAIRLDLTGKAGWEVEDSTAPEWSLLENSEIEAGDNTEVVATTSKRSPEIRILLGVGIDNVAGRENDLIIDDIVADETFA